MERACGGGGGSKRARGGGGGASDGGRGVDDGRKGDGETGRNLGCGMETAAVIEIDEDACAISQRSTGGISLSHGGMGAYVFTGTNIDGGGGCEGEGGSGIEEITEAEYMRGVKRKRGRDVG